MFVHMFRMTSTKCNKSRNQIKEGKSIFFFFLLVGEDTKIFFGRGICWENSIQYSLLGRKHRTMLNFDFSLIPMLATCRLTKSLRPWNRVIPIRLPESVNDESFHLKFEESLMSYEKI